MYERFTDRARKAMQLANQEAQRFSHENIHPSHILLGIVKEGGGVAQTILTKYGVDLATVRNRLESVHGTGPDMVTMGKLPQTDNAKRVITLAIEAAVELKNNWVGTEHLLLGLCGVDDPVVAHVFREKGVTADKVKAHLRELAQEPECRDALTLAIMITRRRAELVALEMAYAQLVAPFTIATWTSSVAVTE